MVLNVLASAAAAVLAPVAYACNGLVNSFNAASSRKLQKSLDGERLATQKNLEKQRQETQLKIAYAQTASQWKLQENSQNFQARMEADRQKFQAKIVEDRCQENRKLQEFIKAVDVAIAKSNQEFQAWLFHQQKDLQKELAEYNRQTQLEIATYQRETVRQTEEYRKILENWPLKLVSAQIIGSHEGESTVPLRVIIAPPEIDYDRFGNATQGFPKMEKRLSQGLRNFLEKNYSTDSNLRPTELLDRAWDSNRFGGGASIKALFGMLKSEPTLVLESEVDGDLINLRLAYWSGGQQIYLYKTVICDLPYREILDWSGKTRALEWETKVKKKLLALGKSEAEINQKYGGDNAINLGILKEQEILQQAGIQVEQHFKTNQEDLAKLCQFLTAYHNLLTGFFADVHYLIHYNLQPQLPQLLPEVIGEFIEYDVGLSMLQWATDNFIDTFKALETDRSALIPDLSIDLAASLASLPDKSFGQKVLDYSVVSWLKARSLSLGTPQENLATLESVLAPEDAAYVEKLNRSLAGLENNRQFEVIDCCYQRGLRNSKDGKYAEGIVAFTQAISLNPEFVDAYYNRGLAYSKTERYPEAITDYSRVIELQPIHAQAFNNRGNAYYKLGEYERAINDFDRAVSLGLEAAAKNRDLARDVWDEVKRKQREEAERLRREEERKLQEEREKGKEFTFEIVTVNSSGKIANRRQGSARQKVESLANNLTLEMVYIPGGTFTMGSPESEEKRQSNESPQHQVSVPPFYLGKYPVTQAQYQAVMGNNPSHFKGEKRPVESVSWHDAVEFCQKLSQKTGKTYRLPSEAEWEYACRAGTTTPFHFGETLTAELANYDASSTYASGPSGVYRQQTTDVGSFPPNAFGLYDMHGNVREWCQDVWHGDYNGAPTDGSAWESGGDSSNRLLRGGSWDNNPKNCRCALRHWIDAGSIFHYRGFRVVLLPGL
ncbi:MAG: SUMF1/EgtB/PvdO family nonheme iron enzyme [Cyanobacteriota bacterium]|nr:SUMF1/EgtB/PvdO family nonheme iron enzyme [Cyanobacteriota bacterium]